jgi:hypothetical protein
MDAWVDGRMGHEQTRSNWPLCSTAVAHPFDGCHNCDVKKVEGHAAELQAAGLRTAPLDNQSPNNSNSSRRFDGEIRS